MINDNSIKCGLVITLVLLNINVITSSSNRMSTAASVASSGVGAAAGAAAGYQGADYLGLSADKRNVAMAVGGVVGGAIGSVVHDPSKKVPLAESLVGGVAGNLLGKYFAESQGYSRAATTDLQYLGTSIGAFGATNTASGLAKIISIFDSGVGAILKTGRIPYGDSWILRTAVYILGAGAVYNYFWKNPANLEVFYSKHMDAYNVEKIKITSALKNMSENFDSLLSRLNELEVDCAKALSKRSLLLDSLTQRLAMINRVINPNRNQLALQTDYQNILNQLQQRGQRETHNLLEYNKQIAFTLQDYIKKLQTVASAIAGVDNGIVATKLDLEQKYFVPITADIKALNDNNNDQQAAVDRLETHFKRDFAQELQSFSSFASQVGKMVSGPANALYNWLFR